LPGRGRQVGEALGRTAPRSAAQDRKRTGRYVSAPRENAARVDARRRHDATALRRGHRCSAESAERQNAPAGWFADSARQTIRQCCAKQRVCARNPLNAAAWGNQAMRGGCRPRRVMSSMSSVVPGINAACRATQSRETACFRPLRLMFRQTKQQRFHAR